MLLRSVPVEYQGGIDPPPPSSALELQQVKKILFFRKKYAQVVV
jgi:hypothetical protein